METSQVSFKQMASRNCGLDVQSNASNKNRIIRILEHANTKLSSVLSATSGLVGTKLIDKICEGEQIRIQDIDQVYQFSACTGNPLGSKICRLR